MRPTYADRRLVEAQLKKVVDAVRDMPHGTTHCDIIAKLKGDNGKSTEK